jgi:hypothetical protein
VAIYSSTLSSLPSGSRKNSSVAISVRKICLSKIFQRNIVYTTAAIHYRLSRPKLIWHPQLNIHYHHRASSWTSVRIRVLVRNKIAFVLPLKQTLACEDAICFWACVPAWRQLMLLAASGCNGILKISFEYFLHNISARIGKAGKTKGKPNRDSDARKKTETVVYTRQPFDPKMR